MRLLVLLSMALAALAGFSSGAGFFPRGSLGAKIVSNLHPEREAPLKEYKPFTIVLYAQNDVDWCERSLQSIFAQDYEAFRVIFIDDGSTDGTFERARDFAVAASQEHRTLLIRNEVPAGFSASLYRAVGYSLEREIILPLAAKDWLASPAALSLWNRAFQNPDVWIAFGRSIRYPTYEFADPPKFDVASIRKQGYRNLSLPPAYAFYSAVYKQLSVPELNDAVIALLELSGGRVKNVWEPVTFANESLPRAPSVPASRRPLAPLAAFPKQERLPVDADVFVFSENNPMQLYAALESLERNLSGARRIAAVYWAEEPYSFAYEEIAKAFPGVQFLPQEAKLKLPIEQSAEYLLCCSDAALLKEPLDLPVCAEIMGKAKADVFALQTGKPERAMPLSDEIFAANVSDAAEGPSMALYRKEALAQRFKASKIEDLRDVSVALSDALSGICLTYQEPKAAALELRADDFAEELLSKFNQGLKIDLDSLFRGDGMEFIPRQV